MHAQPPPMHNEEQEWQNAFLAATWALEALEALDGMGAGEGSTAMRVERAAEVAHQGVADALKGAERAAMRTLGGPGSRGRRVRDNPIGSTLLVLGLGPIAGSTMGDR